MRKITHIIILLFITTFVQAQAKRLDSLRQLLQTGKEDTGRVKVFFRLSQTYAYSKPDSALFFGNEGLLLAKKINDKKGEIRCLLIIGTAFNVFGNYPRSHKLFLEALRIAEEIKDKRLEALALGSLADSYFHSGDFGSSTNYAYKAIEIDRKLGRMVDMHMAMMNLGDSYEKIGRLDSALSLTKAAYKYAFENRSYIYFGVCLLNLGNIHRKMGQRDSAMNFYRWANTYLKEELDYNSLIESYLGMADIFLKKGQTDSCLFYAKYSISIARHIGSMDGIMKASIFLANYYSSVSNIDSAFAYQSFTISAKDSLFNKQKANEFQSISYEETIRQQQIDEEKEKSRTQLRQNALIGGLATLLIVAFLLFLNNRQKQKAKIKIEKAYSELKSTQQQLIQSEKMASLGELTAGIAHEIQNPLNFVNNFSDVNKEMLSEMREEIEKGNYDEVKAIAKDITDNEEKINHHGKRAEGIVKSMLQHSRSSSGKKELTDINALADEYFRLAYHGMRAKDKSFNVNTKTDFDSNIGKINVVPQDIGRVILNLINNAFYAVDEKKRQNSNGYEPTVSVSTKRSNGKVEIKVSDNGNGIPQKLLDKIFQPFFTTKPTGQGTGLGLSLSYDIVKAHGGELKVETQESKGTAFMIVLSSI